MVFVSKTIDISIVNNKPARISAGLFGEFRNFIVEKPIDFWLRKGKAGGEPKADREYIESFSNHCRGEAN